MPLLINSKFFSTGVKQAVEELDRVLAFNNLLISFKNHPDVDRFARGVGPVSLVGKSLLNFCFYFYFIIVLGSFLAII